MPQMLAVVEHPGSARPVTIASTPIRMTVTPGGVVQRAPLAGEHNDRILAGCGFSASDIAQLRESGVIS